MGKTKTYLFSVLMFIVCAGVGFGVTKAVRMAQESASFDEVVSSAGGASSADSKDNSVTQAMKPNESESAESATVSNDDNANALIAQAKAEEEKARKNAESAKEEKKKPEVQKQSFAELTSIINDRSNNNYPRNISIRYTNLNTEDGEEAQTSIANIRSYIRTGVWKSVTVVGATYDERTGKPTSITLQINR